LERNVVPPAWISSSLSGSLKGQMTKIFHIIHIIISTHTVCSSLFCGICSQWPFLWGRGEYLVS